MRKYKQIFALALALFVAAGCLAGCGGETDPAPEMTQDGGKSGTAGMGDAEAMGRYVEKEVPLPEGVEALDIVILESGQLRMAGQDGEGNILLYTAGPGDTWEKTGQLPLGADDYGFIESFALSPKGDVFCGTTGLTDTGEPQNHLWVVTASGEPRDLPILHPDYNPQAGWLTSGCDFTEDGRLMVYFFIDDIREVDLETGSLGDNVNALEPQLRNFFCAGKEAYMLGQTGTSSVCQDGKTEAISGVLAEKIYDSIQVDMINPKVTLWENPEGYLFFTTHDGLYSYIPGGSVVEKLVGDAGTSLGDPDFVPRTMTGLADGSFYVLGTAGAEPGSSRGESVLYHYVYDPEAPAVPSCTLRIYSLYEDEDLRKMISNYQKANLDVAIELEVGMTGADGITEGDAIRTLNTEILAGDGPDILRLDGFSLDTFLEKDLLTDLSGMLGQAGPLIEQVTNCYGSEGKVCAVPTTFALPVFYGPGHILSQIQGLDTLEAALAQARAENPDAEAVLWNARASMQADRFYDGFCAAWTRADGTLDEEKLTEYYAVMKAVYDLDEDYRLADAERVAKMSAGEDTYVPGSFTGNRGARVIANGTECVEPGNLEGMVEWAKTLAGDEHLEGYETVPQAPGVFVPRRIMGILTTSAYPEAAADFLGFMLSDDVQAGGLTNGFPVNRRVFDREIAEDRTVVWRAGVSDASGENFINLEAQYPDQRRRNELKGWVDGLTTPAQTNQIIRGMIIKQAEPCMKGEITPQEAAKEALSALNLYLSE